MKTRLTELLGIKHPIIQGAMAWVSLPPLVAAVSNAGGLGILGSGFMTPEGVREAIREVKSLTDKPFGANLVPDNPQLEEHLDVFIEERVPVVSYGKGDPKRIIERSKPAGLIPMPTMGSLRHSVKAETDGADAVIVQGTEAGGHCSHVSTLVLVPLVVDRVAIPVVAAGGFANARGLLAALSLGAEGISMGTRFMVTKECPISDTIKQRIIRTSEEQTVVTDNLTGVRCRVLRNKLAEEFLDMKRLKVPSEEMMEFGEGRFKKAFWEGDDENGTVAMGQVAGLIDDMPSCQELIEGIVYGTEAILEQARQRVMA
jgi:enoyl-[acyl-carrier protein] reductase II